MTMTQTAAAPQTDGLHTYAPQARPRVTMTIHARAWDDNELDRLARILFGPHPIRPAT